MEQVLDILQRLGVDNSFFIQLALILFMLIVLKFLLLDLLSKILSERQERTFKLEGVSNQLFSKVDLLSKQYKEQSDKAFSDSKKVLFEGKRKIVQDKKSILKNVEDELKKRVESEREKIKELSVSKKSSGKDQLIEIVNSLFSKICN